MRILAAALLLLWAPGLHAAPENKKSAAQLLEELESLDILTRQFAAVNLGDYAESDDRARQALLGALKDWERGLRLSAAYALSKAGPKSAAALAAYDKRRLALMEKKLADPAYEDLAGSSIELKRSGCGVDYKKSWAKPCPQYTIRVHGDGAVLYNAGYGAPHPEDSAFLRDSGAVRKLLGAFGKAKFFELQDAYEKHAAEDAVMSGDILTHPLPFYTLTLVFAGEWKEVRRYSGDASSPKVLAELEAAVDALAAVPSPKE